METANADGATSKVGVEPAPAPRLAAVHPNYRSMLRLQILFSGALVIALVLLADFLFVRQPFVTTGMLFAALGIGLMLAVLLLSERRYRALRYSLFADELHVTHGVWVRSHTIVPVWRIQHIDVAQDPLARWLGLATLVVHTAGTLSSSVAIPGLSHGKAERLRDEIRQSMQQGGS